MGWPARETADLLDTSVAAANSAVQRARAAMHDHLPQRRADWRSEATSEEERSLLERFIDAHERGDAEAAVAIAAPSLRITMPPDRLRFDGIGSIAPLLERALAEGEWRLVPTRANRMPAAASYLRQPGDTGFRAFKIDVLRVAEGAIGEITTFGATLFPAFDLPATLGERDA